MAHSLAPFAIPIPTRSKLFTSHHHHHHDSHSSSLSFNGVSACHRREECSDKAPIVRRRSIAFGLGGAVVGLNFGDSKGANAAARRPPPPPPEEERKDPNVSGLAAKVIASKKRKEAMKKEMAKLREKGKEIVQPPQPPE